MKKFLILFFLTLFLLSPVLSLKAAEPELRWAEDKLIYNGTVNVNEWAVPAGVDDDAIDVDYFAGDTLRAIVACTDSSLRVFRSNDRGQNWSLIRTIDFGNPVTEPHIVHGPDSTYHIFGLRLLNENDIYTRAYRTADDTPITGTSFYLSGTDSVKNYSVCTDRRTNHDYSVFVAYHKGLGGRGGDEISLTRTTDQGQTWSTPTFVRGDGSGFPDITYGNDQILYVAFLYRPAGLDDRIGVRRSFNFGSSWTSSLTIESDTFPKMGPQIAAAYDGSGDVWVIWTKRDLSNIWGLRWSWSQDSGATWTSADWTNSVADSFNYLPSIAINDNYGSTANTPYVSFVRATSAAGSASVRSFSWESGAWNTASRYSDYTTSSTRPVQIMGPTPAIAYVGEGSENVYFDSWENAGVEEKNIDSEITCSLDKSIIAGTATLKYTVKEAGSVKISMFNVLGQEVMTLLDGEQGSGEHTLNISSNNLAKGIYYILIKTSTGTHTLKATLL
jgi:hypothetical protein